MLVETQIVLLFLLNISILQLIKQKKLNNLANIFFTIFLCLQLISYYLTSELIDYRFFIHANITSIKSYIFQFKLQSILLIFFGILIFSFQSKIKNFKFQKIKSSLLLSIFLIVCLSFNSKTMFRQIYEIVTIYNNGLFYKFTKDNKQKKKDLKKFINKNSLNKYYKKSNIIDSTLGKDIVILNLESLDTGFLFGTPELTQNLNFLLEEMDFTKVKQVDGCNWTVGSLFCLMTGIPGYFPSDGNRIFQGAENINLINLGHILSNSGYKNLDYFVGESKFSGQGDLMRTFGFEIYDSYKFKNKIKVYPETFGYHDLDLFNELKKKILDYKKNRESFAIIASTINTHLSGIVDQRLNLDENKKLSNIEKSVINLDYLIYDFINFLKEEQLYEKIALIILPDHLYPNNKSLTEITSKLNTTDRSLYILTNQKNNNKNNITQLDLAKIALNLSDIEHNHLFFSDNIGLIELDEILKNNKYHISEFNKNNISFTDKSKTYQIELKNNILKISQHNNLLQEVNLIFNGPSYVNLVFDNNFIYKSIDNIESKSPKEIRIEDEKGEYKHLILFKNNNKIFYGQYIETKKKIFKKINLNKNIFSINLEDIDYNEINKNYANNKKRFIAHAGGEINNHKYLNSLESLDLYYDKGFKYFELDLMLTSDNFIVAVHDWDLWKRNTKFLGSVPPTLDEFKKYKILKKYTPLDYKQINEWFLNRPDAVLITDKINKPSIVLNQIKIDKKNLQMELFTLDSINFAKKNGINVIVNFDLIKKLENPIKYLNENNFEYVSISHKHTKNLKVNNLNKIKNMFSKSLEKKLLENKVKFLVYGLNDEKSVSEKDIVCKYNDIYFGMYADKWDFDKEFKCY